MDAFINVANSETRELKNIIIKSSINQNENGEKWNIDKARSGIHRIDLLK